MDARKYDAENQNLIERIQSSGQGPTKKDLSLLKKLIVSAKESKDNSLLGFVYYSYAIHYSFLGDHDKFLKNLKLAVTYLLQGNEKELLARSYNLFAIEAQKHGCFEVAYSYYGLAESLVEDDVNSSSHAIIEANTGDLLISIGDTKKARQYLNRSMARNARDKTDPLHYQNAALININIGMCHVTDNDLSKAKKILKKLEGKKSILENGGQLADNFYKIFRLHIAILEDDKKLVEKLSSEVLEKIIRTEYFSELTREIYDVCHALIKAGELKIAKEMIDSIDKEQTDHSFYFLSLLFMNVKAEYYSSTNKRKALLEVYEQRNEFSRKQNEVRKEIYHESIFLMGLINKLRDEEMKAREENLVLQKEAETDALTKLANRNALNRNLEAKYVKALESEYSFGVGIADIDDFKKYNDVYGHLVGDKCLIDVGRELQALADAEGLFVARYGGDEFVLIYENKSDKEIKAIEKRMSECGDVMLTHGFYNEIPNELTKVWDYFVEADKRLYQNKKAKKVR